MFYSQPEQLNMLVVRMISNCVLAYMIPMSLFLLFLPAEPLLFVNNLSMVLLVLAFEVMQKKVRNFFWYTAGHLLSLWLLFLFSPTVGEAMIRLAVSSIAVVIAYVCRLRNRNAVYPGWPILSLGILMSGAGAYSQIRVLSLLGYGTEVLCMILVLLYANGKSMARALAQSPDGSRVPLEKIRRANQLAVGFWIAVAGILTALFSFLSFGRQLLVLTGRGLRFVLQKALEGLLYLISLLPVFFPSMNDLLDSLTIPPYGMGTPNRIVQILLEILQVACTVFIGVLALRLMIRLFRSLYGEFGMAEPGDVQERVFREPGCEEETAEPDDRVSHRYRIRTPADRIRRRYRILIRRSPHPQEIRAFHTPRELEQAAAGGVPEEIHRLYEKARYAEELCTPEDAAAMRQAEKRCRNKEQRDEAGGIRE